MIAISYRRDDSITIAGRLYDRLEANFGNENVFMDFDSMRPGLDFREQIRQTVNKCDVVIALIGPKWLGNKSDGTRRIDDSGDFVRLEIDQALKRGIPVIPVLINDTQMPGAQELPAAIQELSYRHALPLDDGIDFRQHCDRLIHSIANLTSQNISPPSKEEALVVPNRIETQSHQRRRRRAVQCSIASLAIILVAGTIISVVRLRGRHSEPALQPAPPSQSTSQASYFAPLPASAVPSPASPDKESSSDARRSSEKEQLRQFIHDYYNALSQHDLDGVISKFADNVNYQGQGMRNKNYIRRDAMSYLSRWERISFNVGDIDISETPEGNLVARFESPFRVGERNVPDRTGFSSNVWIIHKTAESSFQIVSQQESVHSAPPRHTRN